MASRNKSTSPTTGGTNNKPGGKSTPGLLDE
jgi:hypothetical protein